MGTTAAAAAAAALAKRGELRRASFVLVV